MEKNNMIPYEESILFHEGLEAKEAELKPLLEKEIKQRKQEQEQEQNKIKLQQKDKKIKEQYRIIKELQKKIKNQK